MITVNGRSSRAVLLAGPAVIGRLGVVSGLRTRGFGVHLVSNVEDAIRMLDRHKPALAVLDERLERGACDLLGRIIDERSPDTRLGVLGKRRCCRPVAFRLRPACRDGALLGAIDEALAAGPRERKSSFPVPPLVMCVDSDPVNLRYLHRLLVRTGRRLVVFESLTQALNAMSEFQPSSLVVDEGFPAVYGSDLAAAVRRAAGRDVPMMVMHDRTRARDLVRSHPTLVHASAWIPKPVDARVFLEKVSHLLGEPVARDGQVG
ncbi:MAG TPA: hypothetical protein VEJ18_21810 [Planctomycetota bacterium]|nr:hypothetical protein [Planctomycetota bacterium]